MTCAHGKDDLIYRGGPGAPDLLTGEGTREINLPAWDGLGPAVSDIAQSIAALSRAGFHAPLPWPWRRSIELLEPRELAPAYSPVPGHLRAEGLSG
jgi:hypothetical protein